MGSKKKKKKTNQRLSLGNFLKVEIVTFFSFDLPFICDPPFYTSHITVIPASLAISLFLSLSHSYLPYQPRPSIHHAFL